MNIKQIFDSRSPFRKGDIVKGKTAGNFVVSGPVVSFSDTEVKIKGKEANSFYNIPIENAENLTRQEENADKIQKLEKEYTDLQEAMARVYNEPELEDWYAQQGDKYDGGPLPDYWQNRIDAYDRKIQQIKAKLHSLGWNGIKDSADRETPYAFLMVRYQMPDFIQKIQDQIPQEELYIDENDPINGFGLEKESHVTLFPCLDNNTTINSLIPFLQKVSELGVNLVNVSLFENDEYDVLKADVAPDSPLVKLNGDLASQFECHSEFKEYHPHMTIAYLKKDSPVAKSFVEEFKEPVPISPKDYDFSWVEDGYKHCYFDI